MCYIYTFICNASYLAQSFLWWWLWNEALPKHSFPISWGIGVGSGSAGLSWSACTIVTSLLTAELFSTESLIWSHPAKTDLTLDLSATVLYRFHFRALSSLSGDGNLVQLLNQGFSVQLQDSLTLKSTL